MSQPKAISGSSDWELVDGFSEAEIVEAASRSADARVVSETGKPRRVGLSGSLRFRLGLTVEAFEARYGIPADVLWSWERGKAQPDAVALAYLEAISGDPDAVAASYAAERRKAAE